jgi:drug/metabolite transporter (DMT)-like permease
MLLVYGLLVTACVLTIIGEVMLKVGITSVTERVGAFSLSPTILITTFTEWRVLLGFALVFGGSIFWLGVISRVDLSFAYPLLAMNYVIILIPSRFLLHEAISPTRIVGACIVVAGVIVITWSQK